MGSVDPDALPEADELWWRFAILAAVALSGRDEAPFHHDPESQVLSFTDGSSRLCMQRLYNGRMVLWGRTEGADRPWSR